MTAIGRRLQLERDLWKAVWRQMETALDRIDAARGDDEPHVKTMCALLPVFGVIERVRHRANGYRLDDALAATPAGVGRGNVGAGQLVSTTRIPGVEDCEFAVTGMRVDDDGELTDSAFMWRTTTLAVFRDEKHGTDVVLRAPAYDFGALTGTPVVHIDGVIDGGFFTKDQRRKAADGEDQGDDMFRTWAAVRNGRLDALDKDQLAGDSPPLAAKLDGLGDHPSASDLQSLSREARDRAAVCRSDKQVLDGSEAILEEVGAADAAEAVGAASAALADQATHYDSAASRLSDGILGYQERIEVRDALQRGDGILVPPSNLPAAIATLDSKAAAAMQEAVELRIGYPDGPLRQLRMLEWTLRFFWDQRRQWVRARHRIVLSKLFQRYMGGFVRSLDRVLRGMSSEIPLPDGTTAGKDTMIGGTELALSEDPDLKDLVAGQIAVVGGSRPTAAPVVDVLEDRKKSPPKRLKVPALVVSAEVGTDLPGIAGMIERGTAIARRLPRVLTRAEILRGKSSVGAAEDGLVQSLVAHRSRLALVLGEDGGSDRPAPPPMDRPYPGISQFAVEGEVNASDTRLFLGQVPAASASGIGERIGIARPGEMMLLRGVDADGDWWQTAIEVEKSEVLPLSEARAGEEAGQTAVPACLCAEPDVMVVYVRAMQFRHPLTQVVLHREFEGFGARCLMTEVMLPLDLDGDTASATVSVGGQTVNVRRDPELAAAVKVFDQWMPKETS